MTDTITPAEVAGWLGYEWNEDAESGDALHPNPMDRADRSTCLRRVDVEACAVGVRRAIAQAAGQSAQLRGFAVRFLAVMDIEGMPINSAMEGFEHLASDLRRSDALTDKDRENLETLRALRG